MHLTFQYTLCIHPYLLYFLILSYFDYFFILLLYLFYSFYFILFYLFVFKYLIYSPYFIFLISTLFYISYSYILSFISLFHIVTSLSSSPWLSQLQIFHPLQLPKSTTILYLYSCIPTHYFNHLSIIITIVHYSSLFYLMHSNIVPCFYLLSSYFNCFFILLPYLFYLFYLFYFILFILFYSPYSISSIYSTYISCSFILLSSLYILLLNSICYILVFR